MPGPRGADGRRRVVIEGVTPEIDCGTFPIKRTPGEAVIVEADAFCDGHDRITCVLLHRGTGEEGWRETPMEPVANDRWRGAFTVSRVGRHRYTLQAWVDRFGSWRRDLRKKVDAGQDVSVDLLIGAELIRQTAERARGADRRRLRTWAERLEEGSGPVEQAFSPELSALADAYPDRRLSTTYPKELEVTVDPPYARFSTWYELFPRSCTDDPRRHGTLADVVQRLPYVARMGFDVLYLPPIHPIGRTHRKGRNNTPAAAEDDVGSPWAIGAEEGGHTAIHPDLGTLGDFEGLVAAAHEHGLHVAMDLAYQCSPDHPWVKEHPEWFRHRPDGSIQYAENPPKRYQDIYPIDFETDAWAELWDELRAIVAFWVDRGVRIFRVDNPHTKAFAFWEWMIQSVRADRPDVVFLSEAFTRPKVMYRLAKLGFNQSYTYFTWRNTKHELTEYFTELTRTEAVEFFRPNLWPNTPDILPEYLQYGGRPAFMARLVLAATLGASYGMYGPAFELCVSEPVAPGHEEYHRSEKYEIHAWDLASGDSLADLVARVNRIRHDNPALQSDRSLRFHEISNEQLIAYSKMSADGENVIVTVVNLDPEHIQSGWIGLPLEELGGDPEHPYQVHDLLTDARYLWHGTHNYVELDPHSIPAHIFRLRHRVRTERDFDYFM